MGTSWPAGSVFSLGHRICLDDSDWTASRLAYNVPAAFASVHLIGTVLPALTVLRIGGASTGGWDPTKTKLTTELTLSVAEGPGRSVPVPVNVCVPGRLVSSRPPLCTEAPPSVAPEQLLTPSADEHTKFVGTCWFRVNVPDGTGSGFVIRIDGAEPACSTADWKLTALLK